MLPRYKSGDILQDHSGRLAVIKSIRLDKHRYYVNWLTDKFKKNGHGKIDIEHAELYFKYIGNNVITARILYRK